MDDQIHGPAGHMAGGASPKAGRELSRPAVQFEYHVKSRLVGLTGNTWSLNRIYKDKSDAEKFGAELVRDPRIDSVKVSTRKVRS